MNDTQHLTSNPVNAERLMEATSQLDHTEETLAELEAPRDLSVPFIYIFLRQDLAEINAMYPAIQLGHATYQLGLQTGAANKNAQFEPSKSFCVFQVANEVELMKTYAEVVRAIPHAEVALFEEPDWNTGFTCLAIGPLVGQDREKMAEYQLFRSPEITIRSVIWKRLRKTFKRLIK